MAPSRIFSLEAKPITMTMTEAIITNLVLTVRTTIRFLVTLPLWLHVIIMVLILSSISCWVSIRRFKSHNCFTEDGVVHNRHCRDEEEEICNTSKAADNSSDGQVRTNTIEHSSEEGFFQPNEGGSRWLEYEIGRRFGNKWQKNMRGVDLERDELETDDTRSVWGAFYEINEGRQSQREMHEEDGQRNIDGDKNRWDDQRLLGAVARWVDEVEVDAIIINS
jgi:hypothetical protein